MTVTDRKTVEKFLKIPSTQEIVADLLFSPHEIIWSLLFRMNRESQRPLFVVTSFDLNVYYDNIQT